MSNNISKPKVSLNIFKSGSMTPSLIIVLFIMVVAFSLLNPRFISVGNIKSILAMAAGAGIMATGLSFVILTGNFDFSIGSIMGITVVVVAKLINMEIFGSRFPLVLSLIAGLLIGAAIGAINGFLVTKVGINSIIVTLGTLAIFRGITFWVIIDNIPVRHSQFVGVGRYFIGGIVPVTLVIWIVFLVIMYIFMRFSRHGRNMYLVGANITAARFAGVNTKKTQFLTFIISGCAASIAAIIRLAQIGFSDSTFGTGYEFHVLVICVLGGISLMGGRGTLVGVLISTLIVASISNGLVLAGVEINWREAFIGIILIGAILIDAIMTKRRAKLVL
jgi:ribose transport system permease protein